MIPQKKERHCSPLKDWAQQLSTWARFDDDRYYGAQRSHPKVMEDSVFFFSPLICSIQESIQKYDACIKLPAVFVREISKKQLSGRDEGQHSLEKRACGGWWLCICSQAPSPHMLLCSISWRTTMLRILCSLASGKVGLWMEDHSQKTGGEMKREEARVSFLLLLILDSILGSGHMPSVASGPDRHSVQWFYLLLDCLSFWTLETSPSLIAPTGLGAIVVACYCWFLHWLNLYCLSSELLH